MSIFRSLRDELSKYRKSNKLSQDGKVPGGHYASFRKSTTPPLGSLPRRRPSGYTPDLYMCGNPEAYHPSLNAPAVQETEYEAYESSGTFRMPQAIEPRMPEESEQDPQPIQPGFVLPKDDLTLTELLRMAMGEKEEIEPVVLNEQTFNIHQTIDGETDLQPDDEELTPKDIARKFLNITDALSHLQKVLPGDHPDIVNLRAAMHEMLDDPQAMSKLETLAGEARPSKLGGSNPYERDSYEETDKAFDEQIQMFDQQFESPTESDHLDVQSTNLFGDSTVEDDEPFLQERTLEEIVEDNFDDYSHVDVETDYTNEAMAGTEVRDENENSELAQIEHAIDQIKEEPLPEDPFQILVDPFMDERYIFNPQYVPGYMMHSSMPFGPMGPMPM